MANYLVEALAEARETGELNLSGRHLGAIPDEVRDLTDLRVLRLDSCGIEQVPHWVARLTSLQTLKLADNRLGRVPAEIRELTGLQELSLTGCNIQDVPGWLEELTSLHTLDLSKNRFGHLPAAIHRMTGLQKIYLRECAIREVQGLTELTSLQTLDLSKNQFGHLPIAIRRMADLKELYLWDCALGDVPDWIGELASLQNLDIGGNPFGSVPVEVRELTSLQELDLRSCTLGEVPDWIGELASLQVLGLGHNPFGCVPVGIGELTGLRELRLWDCAIREMPAWISALTLLDSLWFSSNRLGQFPVGIRELTKLRYLDLRNCAIRIVPDWIESLTSLEYLDLGYNGLARVPTRIGALQSLRQLDLSGNELSDFPSELVQNRDLTYLDLTGNLLDIPPEILSQPENPVAILDYIARTVERPKRRLDEAKVLVVGEGAVGKTSLIRRLVADDFSDDERKTEGIDVTQWGVNIVGDCIRLNVWDFGGQEIMHATHQFFLTRRSVYLLVVDNRQDEEQNRIEYWLKLVQSFSAGSPVILVGNKSDQAPLDIDTRGLRNKYPNIVDICSVSCRAGDGIADVRDAVTSAIDGLAHVRDLLPATFFDVKVKLEKFEVDFLPYNEYVQLCQEHGVDTGTSQELLVRFLHDLGTVLCFRDDPRLADTHILNPRWVTGGVYRILNAYLASQRKGLLRWDDINDILDSNDYPPEHRVFIVEMMKKFELCYESDGTFLVPDLLTKEEPDTGTWDGALRFEIAYDVLPSSIISRLIVRMHPHISKSTVWRTGAVFSMDRNRALVQGDREDSLVKIAVTGPPNGRRGLLTAIRGELRAIQKTIPGLTGKERVPVPGHPGHWVPYDHLLTLEEIGRREVLPEGLTVDFDVRELLAGVEDPSDRVRIPSQSERDGNNATSSSPDGSGRGRPAESQPTGDRSSSPDLPDGSVTADAAGPTWTADQAMGFGKLLLAALVICVQTFALAFAVLAQFVEATPAAGAGGVIASAVAATAGIGMFMLRSSGRVSEKGLLDTLKRVPHRN